MNLLAFKALNKKDGSLCSPFMGARWQMTYLPQLGGYYYLLKSDKVPSKRNSSGVYAGKFFDAKIYGKEIYIVAPTPEPTTTIVIGTSGWRASSAIVVDGPFHAESKEDKEKAAGIILSSYEMGYEAINDIVMEACAIVGKQSAQIVADIARKAKEISDIATVLETCNSIKLGEMAIPIIRDAFQSVMTNQRRSRAQKGKIMDVDLPSLWKTVEVVLDDPFSRDWNAIKAIHMMGKAGKAAIPYLERLIDGWIPRLQSSRKNKKTPVISVLATLIFSCLFIGKDALPLLERLAEYRVTHETIANHCFMLRKNALGLMEKLAVMNINNEHILDLLACSCRKIVHIG
ncbi:MAG: hypothetical protein QXT73_06785 [Candidatus Methanomethylicaceae archaeon]